MRLCRIATFLVLLGTPTVGFAQAEVGQDLETDVDEPPRNWGNLRIGASSSNLNGQPDICLELSPLKSLAIEGCGTGSGFLHNSPDPEIAHFRAKWKVKSFKTGKAWIEPQLTAGFAELQIGEDESGFRFSDVGANGVETAGPEIGASLRILVPLKSGVELVGDVQANAAWMEYAPDLVDPQPKFQPSVGVTMGVGF